MATETAADLLVESLMDWNVDTIFGLPGDGINGIIEALRKRQDRIRFIQVRHEEAAALAACAYAKWTGRLGACLATSGPGAIHLLNGLYDARLDGQPVIAITGLQFHDLLDTGTQQDVALDRLFMDVALYNARVMGPSHVENTVELACRTAIAYHGVAHVTVPVDVQSAPIDPEMRSKRNVPGHVSHEMAVSARLPSEEQLARAASILNAGRKTVILAGRGAIGAADRLAAVAERLGAPVVKALLGKGALPDDSPYTIGGVGLLGTRPAQEALEQCDTLLIAGSSFPYLEYYPRPGQARGVQIDLDPQRVGLRFPVEAGLVGDTAKTLEALLPRLDYREDRSFLEKAQAGVRDWEAALRERGTRRDRPMKPQVVVHELNSLLRDDAIIAADCGTVTAWAARYLKIREKMMFSCSGTLATMACALPYAVAAAVAYPERQVICFIGDGGLAMLMGEMATCMKYRLDVKIVVIKNNTLGQIKWEQMVFLGNPEYACDLQPIDFAAVARGFGFASFTIDDPELCGDMLREALATPGPVLVEAVVDPHEPPVPPKVSLEQVEHLVKSLVRGTPARGRIARTIAADTVRQLV